MEGREVEVRVRECDSRSSILETEDLGNMN